MARCEKKKKKKKGRAHLICSRAARRKGHSAGDGCKQRESIQRDSEEGRWRRGEGEKVGKSI